MFNEFVLMSGITTTLFTIGSLFITFTLSDGRRGDLTKLVSFSYCMYIKDVGFAYLR